MPGMYVYGPKLEPATRDELAAKLYEATTSILRVPHIYTFISEYAPLYENGKPVDDTNMITLNLEAGPMPADKIEALSGNLLDAVHAVLGSDHNLTLVYHGNALDHIAIGGKLLKK